MQNHSISYHAESIVSSDIRNFGNSNATKPPDSVPVPNNANRDRDTLPELSTRGSQNEINVDEVGTSVHHLLMSELQTSQTVEERTPVISESHQIETSITRLSPICTDRANNFDSIVTNIPHPGECITKKVYDVQKNEAFVGRKDEKQSKSELEKQFGKYASTILIKGESFYYCQVCMWKTESNDLFQCHFNSEEHQRTVQKLETPWQDKQGKWSWSGTAAAGCIASASKVNSDENTAAKQTYSLICSSTNVIGESDDLSCELTDSESDTVATFSTSQSNKRKQSMPVAVRRTHDTAFDISLDGFSDSILDMDMYPDGFYESLESCVNTQDSDIQVKEEPGDRNNKKNTSNEPSTVTAYTIPGQKTNEITESLQPTVIPNYLELSNSTTRQDASGKTQTQHDSGHHDVIVETAECLPVLPPESLNGNTESDMVCEQSTKLDTEVSPMSLVSMLVNILPSKSC